MKFINLTPHDITVINEAGKIVIPRSGQIARVSQTNKIVDEINGIDIFEANFGLVIDLPEKDNDKLLIVSALVKSASGGRNDLVSPGELVRDAFGAIIGCKGFIK